MSLEVIAKNLLKEADIKIEEARKILENRKRINKLYFEPKNQLKAV